MSLTESSLLLLAGVRLFTVVCGGSSEGYVCMARAGQGVYSPEAIRVSVEGVVAKWGVWWEHCFGGVQASLGEEGAVPGIKPGWRDSWHLNKPLSHGPLPCGSNHSWPTGLSCLIGMNMAQSR